jgi:hypothetical protein
MGLVDDAIKEFQTQKDKKIFRPSSMLGSAIWKRALFTCHRRADKVLGSIKEHG